MKKRAQQEPKAYYVDEELTASDLSLVERTLMGGIRSLCKGTPGAKPGTYKYGGQWDERDKVAAARLNMKYETVKAARRSLTKKGWLHGTKGDGCTMSVRMPRSWYEERGMPYLSNMGAETAREGVVPHTTGVGCDTTGGVPHTTGVGCDTTPSDSRYINELPLVISEAPVALTGSGSQTPGAPLKLKEKTACGAATPAAAPKPSPALAASLRAEAEAWTMQVAELVNRKMVEGRSLRLRRQEGKDPVSVVSMKAEGGKPWDDDIRKVYAVAMSRYPDADPVLAFRAVIREPARFKAQRQHILGHAYRMQAAQGYARPQIKLVSLLRLDNSGKAVPESAHDMAGIDVEPGSLIERALALGPSECAGVCGHAPDAAVEAGLRRLLDPRGRYSAPCWAGCWREAGARCAASGVPVRAYAKHVTDLKKEESGPEDAPVPWIADSVDPERLCVIHAEDRLIDVGFCANWGGKGLGQDGRMQTAVDSDQRQGLAVPDTPSSVSL